MAEMRDKLATALANHLEPIVAEAVANAGEGTGPYPQDWMDAVDVVLAVLREPTEAMLKAANAEDEDYHNATAREHWTAMIHAALCDSGSRAKR